MPKEQIAVAEMILSMIQGKTEGVSKVDFFPQKVEFPAQEPYEQPFLRATPESQGISSGHLAGMIKELGENKSTDIHHLLVLRRGRVICECNFAPYRGGIWHITHSMCKSITGMAVGMLVDEGKLSLNESIYKIFEKKLRPLLKIFRPDVTVEDLLTMRSGIQFNEAGVVSGNDWLESFLNASVSGKPGTTFQYNSLNTYALSAIVTEKTGMTLLDYLRPRLFEPMGITKILWETCPKGITKGGWGLFLCPEDMAKLGQLYLQKGCWKGEQLVPGWWVEESTKKHTDSVDGTYGYGYQIWQEERPGSFEFNGMLGQNVVVYPDLEMVIVTNAGSDELFQNCILLNIIRSYFPPEFHPEDQLPEDPCGQMMLNRLTARLESGADGLPAVRRGGWKPRKYGCRRPGNGEGIRLLDGRCYEMEPQSVGLFPLALQVFHNNMTGGIKKMGFLAEKGDFFLYLREGAENVKIAVGFGRAAQTQVRLHGESYLVGTLGAFTRDEEGTLVLKLDIAFLEEAVRRKLNIFLHGDTIRVEWEETPGKDLILEGLKSIMAELENNLLFSAIKGKSGLELIRLLMERTIEPVVEGKLAAGGTSCFWEENMVDFPQ